MSVGTSSASVASATARTRARELGLVHRPLRRKMFFCLIFFEKKIAMISLSVWRSYNTHDNSFGFIVYFHWAFKIRLVVEKGRVQKDSKRGQGSGFQHLVHRVDLLLACWMCGWDECTRPTAQHRAPASQGDGPERRAEGEALTGDLKGGEEGVEGLHLNKQYFSFSSRGGTCYV